MSEYVGPIVTTDAVVIRLRGAELEALVHERAASPFAGESAIPGVYVQRGETVIAATRRALASKTGLAVGEAESRILDVFDGVQRDPRGHALTVVTLTLLGPGEGDALAENAQWRPTEGASGLAFDHDEIIGRAVAWLGEHLWSGPYVLRGLLGSTDQTTSSIKQAAAALGRDEQTSNLRRRIAGSGFLVEHTGAAAPVAGPGRPSKVWSWTE